MKVSESINQSLKRLLSEDEKVLLLGEDIGEPYGGAFKITKGLQNLYQDRIIQTPMSESALTGIVTGLALNGYKPILEIMFGDFITLCVDQLINHASKFVGLYNKELNMVIRTPMGGYRGYGATHSQTLEKILFGIPCLTVLSMNVLSDIYKLFEYAINLKHPVLLIENKTDYSSNLVDNTDKRFDINYHDDTMTHVCKIKGESSIDGYIIAYGGMVKMGLDLIWDIFNKNEEVYELIVPTSISPLCLGEIRNDKKVYVLDESTLGGGFASDVGRIILERNIRVKRFKTFTAKNYVLPCAKQLEEFILPDKNTILEGMSYEI